MEKIRNLSLKKTIVLYTAISLVCSFFLSVVIVEAADRTQQAIWEKYINYDRYSEALSQSQNDYEVSVPRPNQSQMNRLDWQISEVCDFIQTYIILIMAVLGSCVAVTLFYKKKLQEPIQELQEASKMIAANDLEFHITYKNRDEMGILCEEFEKMRRQLADNNRRLWRMLDDEKALRAAITHDIRSPLATLRGYQEMLLEFVPEDTLDKDRILEMLREGMKQIQRIDIFTENMRKMTRLEDRSIEYTRVNIYEFQEQLKTEVDLLVKDSGKTCLIEVSGERDTVDIDREVVLEVIENLLSNAVRYARHNIRIRLSARGEEFKVCISDDGTGFQESEKKVTQAFFHANPNDDLKHFGLGMYICKIYCEKHGGRLRIINGVHGGASVEASFRTKII